MREISDEVKIGDSATPFKSVRKCLAIDKTASHFDNANLKVKKTLYGLSSMEFTMQAWLMISLEPQT